MSLKTANGLVCVFAAQKPEKPEIKCENYEIGIRFEQSRAEGGQRKPWHKYCFLAPQGFTIKTRDDDCKEDFAMHRDDTAATHNLSPSGFIREGQKSQSCCNDG